MQEETQRNHAFSRPGEEVIRTPVPGRSEDGPGRPSGVLVVLEGLNDIEFLRRISRILHLENASTPDLNQLEHLRRLVFIPFGGGSLTHWSRRLEAIAWPEVHLYDREVPPETDLRLRAAQAVNERPGCCAVVTRMRALENYLHPQAIEEVMGIRVTFSETDSVPDTVCRASLPSGCRWEDLSRRAQKRLKYRAKKWLNTSCVDHMTGARLSQRDPSGELISWLRKIDQLAQVNDAPGADGPAIPNP